MLMTEEINIFFEKILSSKVPHTTTVGLTGHVFCRSPEISLLKLEIL